MQKLIRFSIALLGCGLLALPSAIAQEVNLPEDPSAWLNSPPITNRHLEGKAAFLCFFEEG